MAAPAEPFPDEGEAEDELGEAPLERGGPRQRSSFPGGCFVCPDPEGYNAFTQAPLDPGPSGTYFADLPEPPSDLPGPHTFTTPPPVSASGSSVLTQPGAPGVDGEPWVTRMVTSYEQRFIQLASGLPVSDWNGLSNVAQSDLGETLRRTATWVYIVAMRFADSADNLAARAQELERELNETKDKLTRVRTKLANSLKKRTKAVAKASKLQDMVIKLESELQGARATAAAAQARVFSLETDLAAARAEVAASQERVVSLEAERATTEHRSIERALYGVWRQDPNFDFSSFGEYAVARAAGWSARGRRP
ncbi:uncharacterized protein LOC133790389 isoform X1 [Humulus lupulus]|uniref:uncharacterized protein LOC133790389 isoform X1 n=1 Tax=Humulus lupulus TaxID=3486 RepID=UPI002B40D32D|nr:uncharacterized protein LOC133790389 isoform X1 [Humulus lupulus]XP_062083986.1 uncharacterized protein LOC133790389 isoform X1 [Humulus lupulus]XP_062083987.1 uncharacterized protein LOC133790389 isoform X1 [Humulus lupulus]XP_062083988.1 uncharacterized protein LOC133790389 isoform X1 [Humulus lupulus]